MSNTLPVVGGYIVGAECLDFPRKEMPRWRRLR